MTNRDHSPSIARNDGGGAKPRTEGSGRDLDALERVARAATPGDWKAFPADPGGAWGVRAVYESADGHRITAYPAACQAGAQPNEANARHIAAFDPPTCLALIQTYRELLGAATLGAAMIRAMARQTGGLSPTGEASLAAIHDTIFKATPPPPSARPGEGGSGQTLEERQTLPSGDQ